MIMAIRAEGSEGGEKDYMTETCNEHEIHVWPHSAASWLVDKRTRPIIMHVKHCINILGYFGFYFSICVSVFRISLFIFALYVLPYPESFCIQVITDIRPGIQQNGSDQRIVVLTITVVKVQK